MCMCVHEPVCVFILKRGGIKIATGPCGLVTSSSINWLGYFRATLTSTGRPESATHTYNIETHTC